MAGKTAQSRSPRDAGEGRAQRCAPLGREFWRRRRVREECRRAPLAGGGRGKFSGAGAVRAGDGHRNPAMQPGALPDRERRAVVAVPPSISAGPQSVASFRVVEANSPRSLAREKAPRGVVVAISASDDATNRASNEHRPLGLAEPEESSANGRRMTGTRPAGFPPRRRERRIGPPNVGRRRRSTRHPPVTPTAWCAIAH